LQLSVKKDRRDRGGFEKRNSLRKKTFPNLPPKEEKVKRLES